MKLLYNFHMHSCLSPCASDDMTPCNLVNMCALCGYDAVALTDHNSAANCPAAAAAAQEAGLLFVPGLELTTAEEVHILCLFAALDDALNFSDYVYTRLPDIENNPAIFGRQLLMDADDCLRGELPRMLSGATDIGVYEVAALAAQYGGIAIPAHIDRPSFSLLSNLGFCDEAMGFSLAEFSKRGFETRGTRTMIYTPPGFGKSLPILVNSDAHDLSMIPDAEFTLESTEKTPRSVIDALRRL